MSTVKRTYGSKAARDMPAFPPSSPHSEHASSPASARKRSHLDDSTTQNLPPSKKGFLSRPGSTGPSRLFPLRSGSTQRKGKKAPTKESGTQKQLTQLHFALETSVLRTCSLCSLTYTRGAPDDETLHRAHCARVQRGMEWGKEEEREWKSGKVSIEEVASNIKLKNGTKGRIICFRADVGGKVGAKLTILLNTINITLSAPALTPETLRISKAYLFLLSAESSSSSGTHKEKIIGCVIAQRITTAMAIAPRTPPTETQEESESKTSESAKDSAAPGASESSDSSSIALIPTPLPTPLGVSRLFVSSSHRRLGIGSRLLTEAASTFIHGCPLDPKKGEVAFSQPTGLGGKVLEKWAGGKGRVFEET